MTSLLLFLRNTNTLGYKSKQLYNEKTKSLYNSFLVILLASTLCPFAINASAKITSLQQSKATNKCHCYCVADLRFVCNSAQTSNSYPDYEIVGEGKGLDISISVMK